MNLVGSKNTRSTLKAQSYFYILKLNNWKPKLKKTKPIKISQKWNSKHKSNKRFIELYAAKDNLCKPHRILLHLLFSLRGMTKVFREKSKIHFKMIKRTMFVRQKPLVASLEEKNLEFCLTWQSTIPEYII